MCPIYIIYFFFFAVPAVLLCGLARVNYSCDLCHVYAFSYHICVYNIMHMYKWVCAQVCRKYHCGGVQGKKEVEEAGKPEKIIGYQRINCASGLIYMSGARAIYITQSIHYPHVSGADVIFILISFQRYVIRFMNPCDNKCIFTQTWRVGNGIKQKQWENGLSQS